MKETKSRRDVRIIENQINLIIKTPKGWYYITPSGLNNQIKSSEQLCKKENPKGMQGL